MDQAFIDAIDSMGLVQLKNAYLAEDDSDKLDAIFSRVTQLIAETDSDYDPESGEPEPDFASAAKEFLERE